MEIKLELKPQYRDSKIQHLSMELWRLITQPRSAVEDALRQYDAVMKDPDGSKALDEFNMPKEDLEKIISAYRAFVSSTPDLC